MDRRHATVRINIHHDRVGRDREQGTHNGAAPCGTPSPATHVSGYHPKAARRAHATRPAPGSSVDADGLATQRRAEANHLDHIAPAQLWHRPPPNAHKPTHDYPDPRGDETGDIILKVSLADQRNPHPEEHTERH